MANSPVCSKKAMHKEKRYMCPGAFKVKRPTTVNGVHMPQVTVRFKMENHLNSKLLGLDGFTIQ